MSDRWAKHRPEHNNWDAGGYCNEMVVDDDGYGDVCGYRAPTVERPSAAPRIFGGILPYEAEVAEPNGPRIAAWVLADYADRADSIFKKWLAEHDAQVASQVLQDAATVLRDFYSEYRASEVLDERSDKTGVPTHDRLPPRLGPLGRAVPRRAAGLAHHPHPSGAVLRACADEIAGGDS